MIAFPLTCMCVRVDGFVEGELEAVLEEKSELVETLSNQELSADVERMMSDRLRLKRAVDKVVEQGDGAEGDLGS